MNASTTTRAVARFDGRQFVGRVAVASTLAVGCAAVPAVGDRRFVLAAIIAFVVVPAHFVIRRIAKVPNPTGQLELLAVLSGSLCALVEPSVWTTALVFQSLAIAAAVSYQRARWIAISSVSTASTMAAVAWWHDVPGSVPSLIVFAVFVPVLYTGAQRMQAAEHRASSRVRAAVEGLPILVWEADATTGNLVAVVGLLDSLLGRSRSEVVDGGFARQIHPDDLGLHWTRLGEHGGLGRPYRYVRPDGSVIWLRDHVSIEQREHGSIVRGVSLDVTATRTQEIELQRHQEIVQRMAAATLVLQAGRDGQQRVVHAVDPIGLGVGGSAGQRFGEVLPDLAADEAVTAALDRQHGVERVGPLRLLDPSERFVELEVFPISDDATAVLISDVTEREQSARTIWRQARFDDLTGLPNRVTLLEILGRQTASGTPTALLLIDLNRFKEVNDTLGHLSGDEFLRALGTRLGTLAAARGCTVARLGGDEFAFVTAYESRGDVEVLAQSVIDACLEPVEILGSAVASGASIGIAVAPFDAQSPESLLRCADLAMYRAKETRTGSWWYEPTLDRGADDVETLGRLAAALRNGEFEMFFQPVVELATGRMIGAEALARWHHPTRGLLAPAAFLDLMSVAGLTGELTSIAIEQAVEALAVIDGRFTISINLSTHDLRNTRLASTFQEALDRRSVSPRNLLIEITEEHLLDPTGVVAATLHDLAEIGLRIAVDDFGTGYSSLTHLRSLPLKHLKIDRGFVSGVIAEEHDGVIVRALTELAHNLGLSVTAEGVETEEIAAELRRVGCDFAQGYLWGRPMPLAALLECDLLAAGDVHVASDTT